MVKKVFILLMISSLIWVLAVNSFSHTNHVYINGKVVNFTKDRIKIDTVKEEFIISKEVRIVKHVREENSIYEVPSFLGELRGNDSVTLKVIGNTVLELIIEVYKR